MKELLALLRERWAWWLLPLLLTLGLGLLLMDGADEQPLPIPIHYDLPPAAP